MKNKIHTLCTILLATLTGYLLIQLKHTNTILKEEIEIKYEYSIIIDSLLNESAMEREGLRHWSEENEIPQNK